MESSTKKSLSINASSVRGVAVARSDERGLSEPAPQRYEGLSEPAPQRYEGLSEPAPARYEG